MKRKCSARIQPEEEARRKARKGMFDRVQNLMR
jgi:hypothetical protein